MTALPPPEFWHDVDRPVLAALATLLGMVNARALEGRPSVQISISAAHSIGDPEAAARVEAAVLQALAMGRADG